MISRTLGFILCALALAASAVYLRFALAHLRYPGELDYIEGVMLDHVVRMLEGKPLYVAPSTSFITLAYMPGYTFVASLFAR
jgi:4-hydroxy-L-threonine phosphate dehydrogenase PdxA